MASRSLDDLVRAFKQKVEFWLEACKSQGVDILVYCTYRSPEEQTALFNKGRIEPGPVVTNAPAWNSWHQYKRAIDAVPLRFGKPIWKYDAKDPYWQVFEDEAERLRLEWAGNWKRFREYVHLQYTGGYTLAQAYKLTT